MLLLFLTGTSLPPEPKQPIIQRALPDDDEDEAIFAIAALFSAHRRAGHEPTASETLTNGNN